MSEQEAELAGDIVTDVEKIGKLIGVKPRRIYYLVEHTNFPNFRIGGRIAVRKSVVLAWVKAQEDLRVNSHARPLKNGEPSTRRITPAVLDNPQLGCEKKGD